jgi:hypothetical protein
MSTTNIPYVVKTNGSITLYLNGECLTVAVDHPNYNKIFDAIKVGDFSNIENLVNVAKAVTKYTDSRVTIDNGQIYYGGILIHNTLTERIIKMMTEGFKFDHMIKFLKNIMENPSKRAVDETYWFLENYGLPITDDGCFLAYKAVRNNYTDIYSGKFNNAIGAVVSMPRNMVDDNYGIDCSNGLHVGALDYVVGYGHFVKGQAPTADGNRLLLVKVNPKDVVSVPKYEGHTKMRVCEYTIVSEVKDVIKELDKVVYSSNAQEIQPDDTHWTSLGDIIDRDELDDECSDDDCCCHDGCNSEEYNIDNGDEDAEYNAGYQQGKHDRNFGLEYMTNLDHDASDAFRDGYAEGYRYNE